METLRYGRQTTLDQIFRLAPLSGVAAILLQTVGYALARGVDGSAYRPRGEGAVSLFSTDPGRVELGALIGGFWGLFFLIVFVGCVYEAIREREPAGSTAAIALGGGLVVVVALGLGYRYLIAAAFQAAGPEGVSPEMAAVMFRLYTSSFAGFVSLGSAALLGATGIAALRTNLLPDWLAWLSIVSAVGLLTPAHGLFQGIAVLWVVLVGTQLYRQGRGTRKRVDRTTPRAHEPASAR